MNLDLNLLEGIVKVYGAPLYNHIADAGTLAPGEYSLTDDGQVMTTTEAGVMYFRVRTARLDQGINPEVDTLQVGIFEAARDADGEFNGEPWSVAKGHKQAFIH
jgi:hypothetical protein